MGDWLDDIIDITNSINDIQKDVTDMSKGITSPRTVQRTETKTPWDPTRYAETPSIAYDQCSRHRVPSSGCHECADICPERALFIDSEGDVVIDSKACLGCGLCSAVCPTEALALGRFDPKALVSAIAPRAEDTEVAYLTCSQIPRKVTPDPRITVLPCLGVLTREVIYALLAEHPNLAIFLPLEACQNCDWGVGEKLYTQAIDEAERWSGRAVGYENNKRALRLGPNRDTQRQKFVKDAMTELGGKVIRSTPTGRKVSRVTDLLRGNPLTTFAERFGAFTKSDVEGGAQPAMGSSRAVLLAAIDAHRGAAGKVKVIVSKTKADRCTGCKACVKACPLGARHLADGIAAVERRLCLDCGLCAEVCPADAIGRVRINGRVLVGLSAKPQSIDPVKVTTDIVPTNVKKVLIAMGESDEKEQEQKQKARLSPRKTDAGSKQAQPPASNADDRE